MDNQSDLRHILFEADLILEPEAIVKASSDATRKFTEAEIKALRSKPIKAKVFVDRVEDALEIVQRGNIELPSEIRQEITPDTGVKFIAFGCGFLDRPDCRVTWARLGIRLRSVPDRGAPHIAFVYPRRVTQPITINRERSFEVTLGLEIEQVLKPGLSYGTKESQQMVIYQPTVVSYTTDTEAFWTFEAPTDSWLSGDHEVFLLVRRPASARLLCQFVLGIETRSKWGNVWPFRIQNDAVIKANYHLEPPKDGMPS